jgi:putative aldouronate transport system permease protein
MSVLKTAKPMRAARTLRIRKTGEDRIVDIVTYTLVAIVFLVCAYPFYLSIVLALNEGKDSALGGI